MKMDYFGNNSLKNLFTVPDGKLKYLSYFVICPNLPPSDASVLIMMIFNASGIYQRAFFGHPSL